MPSSRWNPSRGRPRPLLRRAPPPPRRRRWPHPSSGGRRRPARHSREQPLGAPGTGAVAAVDKAVVQAKGAVAPEFDLERGDAEAAPVRGTRNLGQGVLGGGGGDLFFERPATLH